MSLRILLADENLAVQKLVELTLQNEGMDVISTDNSLSALDIALKRTPDLILADFNLEGLDIFSFVQKIRKNTRLVDVPIILLINAAETFDPTYLRSAGVQAFFKKPIDSQELLEEIQKLTGHALQNPDKSISVPVTPDPEMTQHFYQEDPETAKMEAALGWSTSDDSAYDEQTDDAQTIVAPDFFAAGNNGTRSQSLNKTDIDETIQKQVHAAIEKATADILHDLLQSAFSKEVITPILEKVATEVVTSIAETEVKKEISRLQSEH